MSKDQKETPEVCPKCGSALGEITTTKTGRKLQRCVAGSWDPEAKKNVGCDYVKWHEVEPEELNEACPKCGAKLILSTTRFGKKMKKCSTGSWDAATKKAVGCDFVEWINGSTEKLNEDNTMRVDGVKIERLLLNNNPKNFYLEDGVHTGTVVNGFLANAIVEKINTMIDNDIQALSEQEIREAAGLTKE